MSSQLAYTRFLVYALKKSLRTRWALLNIYSKAMIQDLDQPRLTIIVCVVHYAMKKTDSASLRNWWKVMIGPIPKFVQNRPTILHIYPKAILQAKLWRRLPIILSAVSCILDETMLHLIIEKTSAASIQPPNWGNLHSSISYKPWIVALKKSKIMWMRHMKLKTTFIIYMPCVRLRRSVEDRQIT